MVDEPAVPIATVLPKTASNRPLMLVLGTVLLALGTLIGFARRGANKH